MKDKLRKWSPHLYPVFIPFFIGVVVLLEI